MLPTHWGSPCHVPSKAMLSCRPPLPLLHSQRPRSSCQIHVGREFPILGETYSLDWLPMPVRRDRPFPKMLQQSQARGVTLLPHSRAQGQGVLNAAPVLPTSSPSSDVESMQLEDEAQKMMSTFFFFFVP